MNAPWTGRSGYSPREPFHAYVGDDASADIVRAAAVDLGWAPESVKTGGLRNAIQSLSVSASPNILLVDISACADPLDDINGLAEVCEPGTVVIATGLINDVRLFRGLMASGIQDYLLKPLNPEQLRDALAQAQASFNAPRIPDTATERPHMSVAVIGVRGGTGASTIATSLAWLFGDTAGRSTALLDLDIHFGTGALALDLEPGRGLTDAIENPARIDGLFIERAVVRANEKLAILSAEAPLSQALLHDGTAFVHLQDETRQGFECTVLDLPRSTLVQHPRLLHEVNAVVLVTELTLACARDAIRLLSWIGTTAPQARICIVANRVPSSGPQEISRKDFESSIERRIDHLIPLDAKSATQAAQFGKSLAETAKNTKTGNALTALSEQMLASVDGEFASVRKRPSLMGRLGNFTARASRKPLKQPA